MYTIFPEGQLPLPEGIDPTLHWRRGGRPPSPRVGVGVATPEEISRTLLRVSFLEPQGGGRLPPLEGGTEPPGWGSATPVEERTGPPGWGQSPPGGGGGPSAPSSWVVGAALSASRSFGWSLFSGGGPVFRLLEHGGMEKKVYKFLEAERPRFDPGWVPEQPKRPALKLS